jgi:hypothetical protein
MVELHLHSPICLHGILLNLLSTGTTLPGDLQKKFIECKTWAFSIPANLVQNIFCPHKYFTNRVQGTHSRIYIRGR